MNHLPGVGKRNSLGSLLDQTLAAAAKDVQTATARGQAVNVMIDGVSIRDLPTLTDERGSVFELYDVRWAWHPDALVFAHCSTIRPGFVKGRGLHKEHEDRFVVIGGEAMLVLFDPRPDSPTRGQVSEILLSERQRKLVNIPRYVWHAQHNIGSEEFVMIDFPTAPYSYCVIKLTIG